MQFAEAFKLYVFWGVSGLSFSGFDPYCRSEAVPQYATECKSTYTLRLRT